MQTIDDLISIEVMGGWPIYKMNLREILLVLGLENDGTYLKIHVNDPILDIYPERFIDDGMAYGADQQWITGVDVDRKDKYINIWTERELPKERLTRIKNDYLEMEEIIKAKTKQIKDENCR